MSTQPIAQRMVVVIGRSLDTTKVKDWHARTIARLDEGLKLAGA
jgi:hypothetical protein